MRRAKALPTWLAAGSLAASAEAAAEIAPLSAAELYSTCLAYRDEPDSARGRACASYLRGLLDASKRIGAAEARSRSESFGERALRTRAGSRQRAWPRYCLGAAASLEQLVGELLANRVTDAESTPATTAVDRVLQRRYACPSR